MKYSDYTYQVDVDARQTDAAAFRDINAWLSRVCNGRFTAVRTSCHIQTIEFESRTHARLFVKRFQEYLNEV